MIRVDAEYKSHPIACIAPPHHHAFPSPRLSSRIFTMEVDRSTLIFVVFLILMLMPGDQTGVDNGGVAGELSQYVAQMKYSRLVLVNSTYASGYGNLTGFLVTYQEAVDNALDTTTGPYTEDQQHSILPTDVSSRAREVWGHSAAEGPDPVYLLNLTGEVRGEFVLGRSFVPIPMNLPLYLDHNDTTVDPGNDDPGNMDKRLEQSGLLDPRHTRDSWLSKQAYRPGNVTDARGQIVVLFSHRALGPDAPAAVDDATPVSVTIDMTADLERHLHPVLALGVYFQSTGNVLVSTLSGKFWGSYGFPHLALRESEFVKAQLLMLHRFNGLALDDVDHYAMDAAIDAADKCEYVVYLHLAPVPMTLDELRAIDQEYDDPMGRPVRTMPPMQVVDGIMYSPDCGVLVELGRGAETAAPEGLRRPAMMAQVRAALLVGIGLLVVQIVLLVRQMNATNTPSTMLRLLVVLVAMMNLSDGMLTMVCILGSATTQELYLPLLVSAFLAFALTVIFELRYMVAIRMTQMNERSIGLWTALRGQPMDAPRNTDAEGETLLPVAEPPLPPVQAAPTAQATSLMSEAAVLSQMYLRFFISIMAFLFLLLNAFLWRKPFRYGFEFVVVVVLSGSWFPQVYRNVVRGSHRLFGWSFIVLLLLIRLAPVYYLTLYRGNPFHHHFSPALAGTVSAMLLVLWGLMLAQQRWGARFCIPDHWLPKAYDYHPVLSGRDLELHQLVGEMAVDLAAATALSDCAVCMSSVTVPLGDDQTVARAARMQYMVTPCRHVFHSDCLEGWMKYKLQCPVCRSALPPL